MTSQTKGALLASALILLPFAGQAQDSLVFATTNPEQVPLNQGFLIPWAEKINATAAGAVEIDIRHGPMLANHSNFYDRVVDDVVQISWGLTVFNPGRFPRTLVSTLPFMVESSRQGSLALCRMYENGDFAAEFGDIVPLLFAEFPQASLHLNDAELSGFEDVAGKKIITSSPAAAAIVGANGGAPLSFTITEQYEALQRGAADGTILNFTAFPAFRLHEVTTTHLVAPLGGAMGMVFMARDKWEALSPEAQAAIMAHSGCEASQRFGAFVDEWEKGAMAMVAGQEGHTVAHASPEAVEALIEKLAPGIEAGFAKRVPGGAELIARFKEELEAAE
ncbi:TRAP transporter substrate-binding protein [Seohaeicola saemankumensis]|nr:TRAP transporter substrate-binding protein [Seohaeicola saemankumensis]MCA0871510.1 TRAP transporter substrate-binding protein [Seohaeicola saemankumensis]